MRPANERGIALITVLLVTALVSALLVGFTASVMSDQRFRSVDRDRQEAFYAAHAGLEKLTADLGNFFRTNYAPTAAQINALTAAPPVLPSVTFPPGNTGYAVAWALSDANGNPRGTARTISSGPYQGLIALLTQYTLESTALTASGGEVHLRRSLETVAIPVFQFGVFSDTDLSFFPGPNFNFGGRVHTNGNLFLAGPAASNLAFNDRMTAVGEVIRQNMSNSAAITLPATHDGIVRLPRAPGCPAAAGACRDLLATEGSLQGFLGSPANPAWTNISLTSYNGYIRNGATGARPLNLAVLTSGGANPDIVRRPAANENVVNPLLFGERYFSKASLRILLSDAAADITNLPTVTATPPVSLDGNWNNAPPNNGTPYGPVDATHPPIATTQGPATTTVNALVAAAGTTITVNGILPLEFQIPPILKLNGVDVVCTGRLADRFTGCITPVSAAGSIVSLPAAAPLYAAYSPTTATTNATVLSASADLRVVSTAAFAPTTFWVTDAANNRVQLISCSGYTTAPALNDQLLNCQGNTQAIAANSTITNNSLSAAGTSTIGGFIKIEMQDNANVWTDVTMEILNYGIGGPNLAGQICDDPTLNAILRIQRLKDNGGVGAGFPANGCAYSTVTVAGVPTGTTSLDSRDYWPNVLFDPREALQRDTNPGPGTGVLGLRLGGVMHYVALDVRNLSRWLTGVAPYNAGTGTQALNNLGTGYAVYFSDRRNNRDANSLETGEFGWEDIMNRANQNGAEDNALEPPVPPSTVSPEDVNANGLLDLYGRLPSYNGTANSVPPGAAAPLDLNARPTTAVNRGQAQVNRAILFRRALKLINGDDGDAIPDIVAPGLAIVAETPVYIHGNWNARALGMNATWNQPHVATSVAADAVTLLSSNWNDTTYSFANPYDRTQRDRPAQSYYRVAVIAGKNPSFQLPAWAPVASDFGTDGGVHNFLRFLEEGGTLNYRGSLASFYYARQAIGIYKCCTTVYGAPTRAYSFDVDFLNPALLPPLTPVFRDLNTLGFSQETRPGR